MIFGRVGCVGAGSFERNRIPANLPASCQKRIFKQKRLFRAALWRNTHSFEECLKIRATATWASWKVLCPPMVVSHSCFVFHSGSPKKENQCVKQIDFHVSFDVIHREYAKSKMTFKMHRRFRRRNHSRRHFHNLLQHNWGQLSADNRAPFRRFNVCLVVSPNRGSC